MLPCDDPRAPKFWRYETGGQLAPAIENYLQGKSLSAAEVRWIRAYLRQWIESPVWDANPHLEPTGSDELAELRASAAQIETCGDIDKWLWRALDSGIDPL